MEYHFDRIPPVESAKGYMDIAFARAKAESDKTRGSFLGSKKLDRIQKSRIVEINKLDIIQKALYEGFDRVGKTFPSIDSLPEFYRELLDITLDIIMFKKSLAAINWAKNTMTKMHKDARDNIRRCTHLEKINEYRRNYYGRVSSVLKQVDENLRYLTYARKILRDFPTIQDKVFTVAICGFPNVGKSTLLARMTTSKPEINAYPFTTKQILVGYIKEKHRSIQILDTPGTLNRIEKMNNIEKQAHLAMRYAADIIVYVFDLTMEYPIEDQLKLFHASKRQHAKEMIVYFSKSDLIPESEIKEFSQQLPNTLTKIVGPEALRTYLLNRITKTK